MQIHRTRPEVVKARWDAYHEEMGVSPTGQSDTPPPRPSNVRAVLDLGNMVYFEFRGRAYGVPPLPWKEGERLLDLYLTVRELGEEITKDTQAAYYKAMRGLSKVMWRNCRPCGPRWRWARRLGLLANPFKVANERELADVAVFFLGLRTTSTGSFKPGPDALLTS